MKKNKIISVIVEIVIWLIVLGFVVVAFLGKKIFPEKSLMANIFTDLEAEGAPVFEKSAQIIINVIKTVVIMGFGLLISRVLRVIIGLPKIKIRRVKTTITLLQSLIKYGAIIVIFVLVLRVWGVNTAAIMTSASIVALVVGLGCQSLIADIVAGLFILFEGDFQVGDTVVIGGWRGEVISIGIRTTKIVDVSGNVKIINNANISDIVNNSKQLSVAACCCDIDYDEAIERVESVIEANLDYMKKRIPAIVEGPYYKGVETLGASGVTIKLVAKCNEEDKYQVQRDMNREIKIIFDKNKVSIPFNQMVVSNREPIESFVTKNMDEFIDEQRELSQGFEDAE